MSDTKNERLAIIQANIIARARAFEARERADKEGRSVPLLETVYTCLNNALQYAKQMDADA